MTWIRSALAISRPRSPRYDELAASPLVWRSWWSACDKPAAISEAEAAPSRRVNDLRSASRGQHLKPAEVAAAREEVLALLEEAEELGRLDVELAMPHLRPSQVHHLLRGMVQRGMLVQRRAVTGRGSVCLYRAQPLVAAPAQHHNP